MVSLWVQHVERWRTIPVNMPTPMANAAGMKLRLMFDGDGASCCR
jgi:hypothetical protein